MRKKKMSIVEENPVGKSDDVLVLKNGRCSTLWNFFGFTSNDDKE